MVPAPDLDSPFDFQPPRRAPLTVRDCQVVPWPCHHPPEAQWGHPLQPAGLSWLLNGKTNGGMPTWWENDHQIEGFGVPYVQTNPQHSEKIQERSQSGMQMMQKIWVWVKIQLPKVWNRSYVKFSSASRTLSWAGWQQVMTFALGEQTLTNITQGVRNHLTWEKEPAHPPARRETSPQEANSKETYPKA